MENVVDVAVNAGSMSIMHLIWQASLPVKLVMIILACAFSATLYMIVYKLISFRTLTQAADEFEDAFWSGGEMNRLYRDWGGQQEEPEGMANIFVAGYREYNRLSNSTADRGDLVDGVHRAMRVALSRETDVLETNLNFLATVGSTSPYIGLFGTVWGIMNSFMSLGGMQQVTIATVAPGIAEALIATAIGLIAAIPAVIAYNRFSNTAGRLLNRYEIFQEEFLSIVNRQSHSQQES